MGRNERGRTEVGQGAEQGQYYGRGEDATHRRCAWRSKVVAGTKYYTPAPSLLPSSVA